MNAYILRLYLNMAGHHSEIRDRIKFFDCPENSETIRLLRQASEYLSKAQESVYYASRAVVVRPDDEPKS